MLNKIRVILTFIAIISIVIVGSLISTKFLFKEKKINIKLNQNIVINNDITIKEFGEKNKIPQILLNKTFNIKSPRDLSKKISDLGLSEQEFKLLLEKNFKNLQEANSKDFGKIIIKFILWFLFLTIVFFITKFRLITTNLRIILYSTAVILFGVILGSDPNPMSTLKDGIILFEKQQMLLLPRVLAFSGMLVFVIFANKFICGWGCQIGTLQDLIFRINKGKNNRSIFLQIKIPFVVSNTIRIITFVTILFFSIFFALDIIGFVDIFKIFYPSSLWIISSLFIGLILVASLFIYRPWCYFFCPFGLVSWLFENISIFKIRVDNKLCIKCNKCISACPSNTMKSILDKNKIKQDCFSCSSCIEACPKNAINFLSGNKKV